MKFYLVCTVPRLGFRMTALGDSMDMADACFAYETAVGGKNLHNQKNLCCVHGKHTYTQIHTKAWTLAIQLPGTFAEMTFMH